MSSSLTIGFGAPALHPAFLEHCFHTGLRPSGEFERGLRADAHCTALRKCLVSMSGIVLRR
jgi:hypothetical protein